MSYHGMGEQRFVQTVQFTWPRRPPCTFMVKSLKTSFSGFKRLMTLKIGMQHRMLVLKWSPWVVPWGLSASAPALGLYTCIKHEKKYKIRQQRDFFKLATNDWSDKMFRLTSKFCPQRVVSPCPRAIYMYKIMKIKYKTRLQRDLFLNL